MNIYDLVKLYTYPFRVVIGFMKKDRSKAQDYFVVAMKAVRREKRLTQEALAERSGISHITINQIENGKRRAELASLEKIAEALNSTVEHLIIEGKRETLLDVRGFREALGKAISSTREERDLSKTQLARETGISGSHITNIEEGISSPTTDKIYQISIILNCSMVELYRKAEEFYRTK